MAYDFNELLSPDDFELLCKDILKYKSKEYFLINEGFDFIKSGEGKDGGVDLHFKNKEYYIIAQSKRVKSISNAQIDKEYNKITKLNPSHYVFISSKDPLNETVVYIENKFKKWMPSSNYIINGTEINSILSKEKEILRKNYKLWISNSIIFTELTERAKYNRSDILISNIRENIKFYVKTKAFHEARKIINSEKIIIISGNPGIGKSTLAKLLIFDFLLEEYNIIQCESIDEIEQEVKIFSEEKKLLFLDDFLGEDIFKPELLSGKASRLINVLNAAKYKSNAIIILTTRGYVLNQAKNSFEKINQIDDLFKKITLSIETNFYDAQDYGDYGFVEKARILYNHLFYSTIEEGYIANLIENKKYLKIINHENYSPRIIESLTIYLKAEDTPYDLYYKKFISYLENPEKIWESPFGKISKLSRYILYIINKSPNRYIWIHELEGDLRKFSEFNHIEQDDLTNSIRELQDDFINVEYDEKELLHIWFKNPSIRDYLNNKMKKQSNFFEILTEKSENINDYIYAIRSLSERKIVIQNLIDNYETITFSYLEKNMTGNEIDLLAKVINADKELESEKLDNFILEKTLLISKKTSGNFGRIENYYVVFENLIVEESLLLEVTSNLYINTITNTEKASIDDYIYFGKLIFMAKKPLEFSLIYDLKKLVSEKIKLEVGKLNDVEDAESLLSLLNEWFSDDEDIIKSFNLDIDDYIDQIEKEWGEEIELFDQDRRDRAEEHNDYDENDLNEYTHIESIFESLSADKFES